MAAACDKVPLLAPTQSTITLTMSTTTLPANGTAQVLASVTEQSGTPVHNGTMVTFTGSLGTFDPVEAFTENGTARTTFRANGQSGTVKIGAVSGSAKATEIEIKIGGAAAESVTLRAEPGSVSVTGGTVTMIAVVSDISGNPLPGTTVVFSSDAGQLSQSTAATDASGEARTALTTNRETVVRARVGAKEGTVTVRSVSLPSTTISVNPTSPIAGQPVTFTVTPGATTGGNPIREVTIDFGDGTPPQSLGAISGAQSVQHTYVRANSYVVTTRIVDISGLTNTQTTTIIVQSAVLFPSISAPTTGQQGTPITISVTVTNPSNVLLTSVVLSYGDGTQPTSLTPSGGSVQKTYTRSGVFTLVATLTTQTGQVVEARHTIEISPAAAFQVTLDAQKGDDALEFNCVPPGNVYPKTCNTRFIGAGVRVIFTAGGTPPFGANITGFEWQFGDGSPVERTTSNSVDHVFRSRSDGFNIQVTVFTTNGNGTQRLTLIVQ